MVRVLISDFIGGSGCVPAFASKRFDPPTLFNNLACVVDSGTAPRIASSPGNLDLLQRLSVVTQKLLSSTASISAIFSIALQSDDVGKDMNLHDA